MEKIQNDNIDYKNLDLYIPIYPFRKTEEEQREDFTHFRGRACYMEKIKMAVKRNDYGYEEPEKPISLNLIISIYNNYDVGYSMQRYNDQKKYLHFLPIPDSLHISDLQFMKINNKKEFDKYFICKKHKCIYSKFCNICKIILCSKCLQCTMCNGNIFSEFNSNFLDFEQFDKNRSKIKILIKQIISEFFPNKISEFDDGDFCSIKTEKIFLDKVNKILINKEYNAYFLKKLKLLILDLNFFMTSALKIYNSKVYFSENNLLNIDLFKEIEFLNPLKFNKNQMAYNDNYYISFYKEKDLKRNIISSLNNFIKLENNIHKTERSLVFDKLREFPDICKIFKIENTKYLLLITYNFLRIYDNNGLLVLEENNGNDNIILLSKNIIVASDSDTSVLYIEYNKENIPIKINKIKIFQNYFIEKFVWIKSDNILVALFGKSLCTYKITDIKNFNYNVLKRKNLENLLNIELINEDELLEPFNIDLIFNKYNSTLILTNMNNDFDKIFINIIELKNLSIIEKIQIKYAPKPWENFSLKIKEINGKHFLIILCNISGKIFNVCLDTNELINIFEFHKYDLENIYSSDRIYKFNFFILENNNNEIIIFREYNKILKVFKIKENDFINDENNDKLKNLDLDKFRKKNYSLLYMEPLDDERKYAVGYLEIMNFFNDKLFYAPKLKIVNLNL